MPSRISSTRKSALATLTLQEAQQIIATDWFLYYRDHVLK